jgi:hypothetical protein
MRLIDAWASVEERFEATNQVSFKMMSLIQDTLYGLFRDPYTV